MPLQLTTPVSTGDLDQTNSSYTHVKITHVRHNAIIGNISVTCQYGVLSEGEWTPGVLAPTVYDFEGDDYTALLAEIPAEGETAYIAVSRCLVERLVTNGIFSGTYVVS